MLPQPAVAARDLSTPGESAALSIRPGDELILPGMWPGALPRRVTVSQVEPDTAAWATCMVSGVDQRGTGVTVRVGVTPAVLSVQLNL